MMALPDQRFLTRFSDAGYLPSNAAGRFGLALKLPPQFGQTPWCTSSMH